MRIRNDFVRHKNILFIYPDLKHISAAISICLQSSAKKYHYLHENDWAVSIITYMRMTQPNLGPVGIEL